MPGRASPRSEGKCPTYGKEEYTAYEIMQRHRNNLHNMEVCIPGTDMSGAGTQISLVWNPSSEMKRDFNLISHRKAAQHNYPGILDQHNMLTRAGWSSRPAPAPAPDAPAITPRARDKPPPTFAPPEGGRPFLDGETARLKACAPARMIGQTFLTAGNLAQAKLYLARAEEILQVDERHLRGKSAKDILDEYAVRKKSDFGE